MKTEHDAYRLAQSIMGNTGTGYADDFFTRCEHVLLTALVLYVSKEANLPPEGRTISALYNLLTSSDLQLLNKIFINLPDESPARKLFILVSNSDPTTRRNIFVSVGIRIKFYQFRNEFQ